MTCDYSYKILNPKCLHASKEAESLSQRFAKASKASRDPNQHEALETPTRHAVIKDASEDLGLQYSAI